LQIAALYDRRLHNFFFWEFALSKSALLPDILTTDLSVRCRTCDREIAGSNPGRGYCAPRSTQPTIPPG